MEKSRIVSRAQLERRLNELTGLKVILTCGVFDFLKPGHIDLFESARHYGDILVLGVCSRSPYTPLEERLEILESIESVNLIFTYSDTAEIKKIARFFSRIVINDEFRITPEEIDHQAGITPFPA